MVTEPVCCGVGAGCDGGGGVGGGVVVGGLDDLIRLDGIPPAQPASATRKASPRPHPAPHCCNLRNLAMFSPQPALFGMDANCLPSVVRRPEPGRVRVSQRALQLHAYATREPWYWTRQRMSCCLAREKYSSYWISNCSGCRLESLFTITVFPDISSISLSQRPLEAFSCFTTSGLTRSSTSPRSICRYILRNST